METTERTTGDLATNTEAYIGETRELTGDELATYLRQTRETQGNTGLLQELLKIEEPAE